MKLAEGAYFGASKNSFENQFLSIKLTSYEPLQTQPWHTHEHPTLFIHLRGEHLDMWSDLQVEQPVLSAVFHPATTAHRSDVGPLGMVGVNIELKAAWQSRFETGETDLGGARLLDQSADNFAALRLTVHVLNAGTSEDLEALVFELVAPVYSATFAVEPQWLRRAHELIQGEVESIAGVSHLAREIGVHPGHLSHCYRRRYGTTVTESIQRARISRAARLMLHGFTAGNAAAESGWSDQFHLSRTMRKRTGLSPRDAARIGSQLNLLP